jgi:ribosomal protein S18 acetylase RimI-like enzyme
MMDDVRVSSATTTDAVALADLINSAYRAQGQAAGWTHEVGLLAGSRTDTASISAVIAKGEATVLLLRRGTDAKLLGCISVEPMDATRGYISMLAIDPEQQACGHGRLLLAEAETFAYAQGAEYARMTVIQQRQTLIAWYERRGYCRTGEVIPFPYDDPSVGTPLRNDLRLVVLEKPLTPTDTAAETIKN